MKTNYFYVYGLLAAAVLPLGITGCGVQEAVQTAGAPSVAAPWDYSDRGLWLAYTDNPALEVDVFCVYPTRYTGDALVTNELDAGMVEGAKTWLTDDASCMEGVGNFFAPYYRQANAVQILSLPLAERGPVLKGVPYHDVEAAFDYYIRNLNQGRPFIVLGHSQGANILLFLLEDYLADHPEVYQRMIAAYLLGISVTTKDLQDHPYLKFAEGPDDTGVIISYNTETPGITSSPLVHDGALAINPINWKRDDTLAPASENAGSFIGGKKVMDYADAQLNLERGGVVICTTVSADDPQWALPPPFPKGSFHQGDIAFYYYNLRENAKNRVEHSLVK